MGGVAWGLLLARLSLLDGLWLSVLAAVIIGSFWEPLVGVGAALFLGPLWAWLRADLPQIPPLIGQVVFVLAAGLWLLRGLLRRDVHVALPPLFLPLLLFMGATLLSLWRPLDVWAGLLEFGKWGQILLMFLIVYDRFRGVAGRKRVILVLVMLAVVAVFQALVGLWQFGLSDDEPAHFAIDARFFRAYGTFEQPNPYAGFLGMMGAILAGVVAVAAWEWVANRESEIQNPKSKIQNHTWFAFAALVAVGTALLASWSRGGWMGFGAALLVIGALLPRRGVCGVVLVALVVVGGLGLYSAGLLHPSIADRLTGFLDYARFEDVRGAGINDANYAVIERMAHWQAALSMWRARFWLGVGFGGYEAAYADYRLINWPIALGHAHNYYLNLLAETGTVGLAAYSVMLGSIFVSLWQASRRTSGWERGLALGLAGAWTHFCVHNLVDNILVNNVHLHLGVMFALSAWLVGRGGVGE